MSSRPPTNQKPSVSGFWFERRNGEAKRSFRPELLLRAETERADADSDEGQANKSARGMPWHQEPMKDVISCDKLRGAANEH